MDKQQSLLYGRSRFNPQMATWIVARMGYSLTGQTNGPAALEATGYEVDKLKKGASQGMMGQHGVNDVATDSWEAGFQNWTDDDCQRSLASRISGRSRSSQLGGVQGAK
jgi:hypothetical protein